MTIVLRMRPVGMEFLQDLVDSADLDPTVRGRRVAPGGADTAFAAAPRLELSDTVAPRSQPRAHATARLRVRTIE